MSRQYCGERVAEGAGLKQKLEPVPAIRGEQLVQSYEGHEAIISRGGLMD